MTRFGYVMVTYFATMGVAIAAFIPTPLRLVWNASASVPIGLYDLDPPRDLAVGDLVAVMPDKPLADFMVERGYIGRGVPLMKRVMGLPGQRVCRTGNAVTVDAVPLGDALDRDRHGRELPVWQGCRRIATATSSS
jgi:type IV secretory pathway protease TraF